MRLVLTTEWKFELRRRQPMRFVSRKRGGDLLEQALGRAIGGLHVHPEHSIEVRRNGPRGFPGVVIGLKARYEIDIAVDVLLKRGVAVVGTYVLAESELAESWPGQDAHARRRLVGRVVAVDGGTLVVRTAESEVKIDAAKAWIESNKVNFHAVLRKVCGRSFDRDLATLESKIAAFNNAERRIADTDKIAKVVLDLGHLDIAVGMRAQLAMPLRLSGDQPSHLRTLVEPTFVFDQSGDKTDRYPDSGLTRFGPLDAESFTPKVWLGAGEQIGYLPGMAANALGWS